jgi:hypothetical protein
MPVAVVAVITHNCPVLAAQVEVVPEVQRQVV